MIRNDNGDPLTWDEAVVIFTEVMAEYANAEHPDDVEVYRSLAEVVADTMQERGWVE